MSVFLPYMFGSSVSLVFGKYVYDYVYGEVPTPSLTPHSMYKLPSNKIINVEPYNLDNNEEIIDEEIIYENIKKKNIIDK